MANHFILLVNPEGGEKKGLQVLKKIDKVFKRNNANLTLLETQYKGHAEEIANSMDFAAFDGFCAIGGDGTIHEIINGMLSRKDKKRLPIGLITGGTGNSFMHDMDCLNPIKAAERIVRLNHRPIDIISVKFADKEVFSFNVAGWGMVAEINEVAEKIRWFGKRRYDAATLYEILKLKNFSARLSVEGKLFEDNFIFIIACNTVHTGKGMKIAPKARVDDGLLDLLIVRKATRRQLLNLFPKVFKGKHLDSPILDYMQVKEFSIDTKVSHSINIDGELFRYPSFKATVLPKAIHVLV